MKKKIILQSFLIAFITAIAVFCAGIATHYWAQEKRIKQEIVADSEMFAAIIKDDIDSIKNVNDFGTLRITILDTDGDVYFDSAKEDSSQMDNHLEREEVAAALRGTPKIVKRYSDTFGYDMYYYAVKIRSGGEDYILRVAEKASNVWSFTSIGILYVGVALIFALLLSFLLATKLSGKVENQLKGLRDNLRDINSGCYSPIESDSGDALSFSIISEMNELVGNLKETYDEIKTERAKLYGIIDNMTQGIIVVDKDKKIILTNNVAASYFGKVKSGESLECISDDRQLYDKINDILDNEKSEIFNCEYSEKDLVINVFTMSIEENEREDKMGVILVSDVTKEKEVSKQKSMFFANASHELKTPLTSIQGLSEVLLSRTEETSPDYKYIKRIYTESVRMHNMVMDMLYISKLESRNIAKNHEEIDLEDLCREAEQAYKDEITDKDIGFVIKGHATLEGDSHNLYECINNVIGNAVHYNNKGGKVSVSLSENDEKVNIVVKDSGIGIAKEHIPYICERFYRVDKSRSKQTGGTGLGLSIVKHIVALYDGRLEIDSELGKGTSVSIEFPKPQKKTGETDK